MKWEEQQALFEKQVTEERDLLNLKGREYAGDADALATPIPTGGDRCCT